MAEKYDTRLERIASELWILTTTVELALKDASNNATLDLERIHMLLKQADTIRLQLTIRLEKLRAP